MIIKIFLNISIQVQRRQRLISKLIIMNFYNYSRTSDVFTVYEFDFFSSLYNVKCDVTIFDTTIQFIFTKTITVEKIKNTTFLI